MKRQLSLALAAGLVALAGCNGGGGLTPQTPNAVPNGAMLPVATGAAAAAAVLKPAGSSQNANFEWGRGMRERMTFVKPVSIGAMEVLVGVRMRDARGLLEYAHSASDPKSPNYRHFLTPQQIADRFGASDGDYKMVAKYFTRLHMRVGMWPQREVLTVTGTIAQLQRAFGTTFGYFYYGKHLAIAPMQAPHFSQALPVSSVLHLTTYNPAHTYYVRGIYSHFAGYPPQMLASGFDYSGAYSGGYTGAGVTLGINGTWQISPADVPALGALWHTPVGSVSVVNASPQPASPANGNTGTGAVDPYPAGLANAPPITAPCNNPPFPTPPNYNTCNPEDVEAQLDTEQVASLAPGANTLFYLAYNPSICVNRNGFIVQNKKNGTCPKGSEYYPLMGIQLADDSLQQAIADNRSDTQSLSWGEPENDALASGYISSNPSKPGVGQIEFASFAAEGIAVFVSSGDNGAWECFDPSTGLPLGIACVSYPASDPNVVAVGGVNAPIGENGVVNGQITAWADNTTGGGNGHFQNNVGSGGGISAVFPATSWQSSAVHNTMRQVPDISLDADPATGPSQVIYAAFKGATEVFADGGTSASAPEANAEWGLVLSACAASATCATATGGPAYRLGNPAPLYYALYSNATSYKNVFYDVIYGNNQAVPAATPTPLPGQTPAPLPTPVGYSAGKGYDMVTGVGVPYAGHLINNVVKGTKLP